MLKFQILKLHGSLVLLVTYQMFKVCRSEVQVVKELSPIVTNSKYLFATQCRRPYIFQNVNYLLVHFFPVLNFLFIKDSIQLNINGIFHNTIY